MYQRLSSLSVIFSAIRPLPFLEWLAGYGSRHLKANLFTGLTLDEVSVPQSIAYTHLSGVPACRSLYAAFLPPVVAALSVSKRQAIKSALHHTHRPKLTLKQALRTIRKETQKGGSERNCPLTTVRELDHNSDSKGV